MPKYADIGERIVANCVLAEENQRECFYNGTACWLWEGKRSQSGYPRMQVRWKRGPRKGEQRSVGAHRESLKFFKGTPIRKDYVVKHLCNNRLCCNPDHLQSGTQKSNIRQCVREGRHYTPFRSKDK